MDKHRLTVMVVALFDSPKGPTTASSPVFDLEEDEPFEYDMVGGVIDKLVDVVNDSIAKKVGREKTDEDKAASGI